MSFYYWLILQTVTDICPIVEILSIKPKNKTGNGLFFLTPNSPERKRKKERKKNSSYVPSISWSKSQIEWWWPRCHRTQNRLSDKQKGVEADLRFMSNWHVWKTRKIDKNHFQNYQANQDKTHAKRNNSHEPVNLHAHTRANFRFQTWLIKLLDKEEQPFKTDMYKLWYTH